MCSGRRCNELIHYICPKCQGNSTATSPRFTERLRIENYSSNSLRGTPDCRMMERRVPVINSLWSGTGTVVVPPSTWSRRMTTWLPRCRTWANPCRSSIAQTSLPDSTRSLPKRNLKLRNEHIAVFACSHLRRRGAFVKQFYRLAQIG